MSDKSQVERERMVRQQLRGRDITDPRVLEAMATVPRHQFVPNDQRGQSYDDGPIRIAQGQTISQPYMVALMAQILRLEGDETVLEIGTGSGYQAAVLAELAAKVYSIERIPELADGARRTLSQLGYSNITVIQQDGSLGLPEHAPYPGIAVTAAAPRAPDPLKEQLSQGGILVVPVGSQDGQMLERWRRVGEDEYEHKRIAPVAFVPLLGEFGWESDRRRFWSR